MYRRLACLSLVLLIPSTPAVVSADGPGDNVPASVRRMPRAGIALPPEVKAELEAKLAALRAAIDRAAGPAAGKKREWLPDVEVLYKAVHDALTYDEFFAANEVDKARKLIDRGVSDAAWLPHGQKEPSGLVVRGYRSKIDGSVQPYGLVIPEGPAPRNGYRLDLWFHGRNETLSELNFIDDRLNHVGEFSPPGTIVLHPYGRYCNAAKFAGEIDALEAIESVKARFAIDPDRVSVRGFSMGGASTWHFAVHYPDHWFAANPGAGFSETPRFLNVFQRETLQPTWYEKTLWHLYDCTDVAENIWECPTVAYSGALDNQKQAADVMAEALDKVGLELTHVIGPGTRHQYHPDAKAEVERRLADLAVKGRERFPYALRFATYTLRYNRTNWLTLNALGEHWKKASVKAFRAVVDGVTVIQVDPANVDAFTVEFPEGVVPATPAGGTPSRLVVTNGDGIGPEFPAKHRTDRSFSVSVHREEGVWKEGRLPAAGLRKKHGLQGPIDDAFMDSFIFVRPTGKSPNESFAKWSDQESKRAVEHWRRHFRGEVRVKDDARVNAQDIASSNLVLWGDPASNAVLARVADRLPVKWTGKEIAVGGKTYDAANHAVILIYPNPLNPEKYVVLNSGFTFREYDYLNNARQVPRLPDWAVVDLRTPPDAPPPGKVVAADFFGEKWEVKPEGGHD